MAEEGKMAQVRRAYAEGTRQPKKLAKMFGISPLTVTKYIWGEGDRRKRACKEKIQHPTQAHAEAAMVRLLAERAESTPMSVYRCDHCGFFHYGHLRTSPFRLR